MKRYTEPWPILNVFIMKGNIDPRPQYQRTSVWTLSQKQLLLDSVLRNIDVPKLYITRAEDEKYEWEVVDGQQRLRAIWEFFDGEYRMPEDSPDVGGHKIAGQTFSDLHPDLKNKLHGYSLTFIILEEEEENEIEDMFLRLQSGTTLNNPEKRMQFLETQRHLFEK